MLNPEQFIGKDVFLARGSKILGPLRIHSHEVERAVPGPWNNNNPQEWHTIAVGEGGKHEIGVNPAKLFETHEEAQAHVDQIEADRRRRVMGR